MDISVIIPTYQSEKYISRAIRSVLNQSLSKDKYEIIVINDGSTDNTEKIIEHYQQSIRYIKHETNLGLSTARNTGIKNANGRFIVFLDSDDYMHVDLLKIGYLFLSLNNSIDAVSFDYYLVNDKEVHISRESSRLNPIACGIMYRTEQIIDIGFFDEEFFAREEEDFRIRFTKKYSIKNIELPLYRYRRHSGNLTNNKENMDKFKNKLGEKHGDIQ